MLLCKDFVFSIEYKLNPWCTFLVVSFFHLAVKIYFLTPFCPSECLLRNQMIILREFPCVIFVAFRFVCFSSLSDFYQSNWYVTQHVPSWIYSVKECLWCLDLDVCFFCLFVFFSHFRNFSIIISSNIFASTFTLFSFWDPYTMNVDTFSITPRVSEAIFIHLYYFIPLALVHSNDFCNSVFQVTYLFFYITYSVIDSF